MSHGRQCFATEELDRSLGGGLLPGTLTLIAGATGAGKTQLGLRWADAGLAQEGHRGVLCDLTSRGDSQNHAQYAARLFDWSLRNYAFTRAPDFGRAWDLAHPLGDYFHPVDRAGRKVTREDLEEEEWHEWKSDMARVLRGATGFFYQHFARGCRRAVFDGLEPASRASESIQFEFLEYIYHHVLRQDDEWAAREWLRENYRANEKSVLTHRYDHRAIGCVCLYTTPQVMLEDLIAQPIGTGELFATANTIILMGRTRHDGRLGRALVVPKHRGSACSDEIIPYRIGEEGIVFD
jgi:KaiC/GvpD/RAD55 family RecA-like ATPase